jgi:hypothetical protein
MCASELFSPVHGRVVILLELEYDASVVNSLFLMRAKNGFVEEGHAAFEVSVPEEGRCVF